MSTLDVSIKSNHLILWTSNIKILNWMAFPLRGYFKIAQSILVISSLPVRFKVDFSGVAKTIVSNPNLLTISDYVNMWGPLSWVSLMFVFSVDMVLFRDNSFYYTIFLSTFCQFRIWKTKRRELYYCEQKFNRSLRFVDSL